MRVRPVLSGWLATAALVAAAVAGCGGEPTPTPELVQEGPATGHVHAIGVDPADGSVIVAAHTGLFRAAPGADRAEPTGDARDAMGFTVEGPARYVASGHPALGSDEPQSVGLIRSTDAGRTWRSVSLSGEADLHVLDVGAGGRVYGYDAMSGQFLASADDGRSWRRTSLPPVLDVAVDPEDADTVVASGEEGLLRSTDGGGRWRAVAALAPGHLLWTDDGLVLLGLDGAVHRMSRPGERPRRMGELPMAPAAAAQHDGDLLVAGDDGSVLSSGDGGRTWRPRLAPAA